MAFPNSPLDPVPAVFGWPWHGQIRASISSNGVITGQYLTLPSGATMPMQQFGGSWTYLWDIGMPEPSVLSTEPDEQWSNKAVLRGSGSASPLTLYCYGGTYAGIVYLGESLGAVQAECQITYVETSGQFVCEVTVDQTHYLVCRVDSAQLAFDSSRYWLTLMLGYAPYAVVLDRSKDGRKLLVGVMVNDFGWAVQRLLAVFELEVVGAGSGLSLASRVVVDCNQTFGTLEVATAPAAGSAVGNVHGAARIGTFALDCTRRAVVWAWYKPDGSVELIQYSIRKQESLTRSADIQSSHSTCSEVGACTYTFTLSSSAGEVGATIHLDHQLSYDSDFSIPGGHYQVTGVSNLYAGSEHLHTLTTNVNTPGGGLSFDATAVPELLPSTALQDNNAPVTSICSAIQHVQAQSGQLAVTPLSNKVVALVNCFQTDPELLPSEPHVVLPGTWAFSAVLTPTGEALAAQAITCPGSAAGIPLGFNRGSYNPVTGAVVANELGALCSWV